MNTYDYSVFLNCPFDDDYQDLFNVILFTVHRCGFILRCSKEFDDNSKIRINNIVKLIKESKYSIHDISRIGLDDGSGLPRFNMPLELGIAVGAQKYGRSPQSKKQYLILESEKYRFKIFISDISGQDIKEHKDDPKIVVKQVRNWLSTKTGDTIPSGSIIYKEYEEFKEALPDLCTVNQWIKEELTYQEYVSLVVNWLTLDEE